MLADLTEIQKEYSTQRRKRKRQKHTYKQEQDAKRILKAVAGAIVGCLNGPMCLDRFLDRDVHCINTSPVLQGFPWERHAPAWLPEPGWSPAIPGESTGEGLTKWTSRSKNRAGQCAEKRHFWTPYPSTHYSKRVFYLLSVLMSYSLYHLFSNTQAGSRFADKTRQAIALEHLCTHRTHVIVYAGGILRSLQRSALFTWFWACPHPSKHGCQCLDEHLKHVGKQE